MTLTLSMIRCPDGVPPETRQVGGGEFSIGRSSECDWVLPDPERVLSKRHCLVMFRDNAWQVTDTSTNGTYLNHELKGLGPDAPRVLRDGDRLVFGSYEIEVLLNAGAAPLPGRDRTTPFTGERLTGDPFPMQAGDPLGIAMPPSIDLPQDFDPIGKSDVYPVPDRVSDLQGSYRAPRPSLELLPDDWDQDDGPVAPPPAPPPPAITAPVLPEAPLQAEPLPPLPVVQAAGAPVQDAFAAFAAGAGVSGPPREDPLDTLRGLGSAFRAVVAGLRRMMIARAAIKGEFRIDRTMIQAVGNNPLKFSADDDDALAALLGIGRHSDMTPERAVSDAMRDMRLHELAMSTAMLQAVRDMLAELGPARVQKRVRPSFFDRLPGRRRARAWSAYEALHAQIVQALTDDFDSVFGKAFVRAYERAMAELAAQDGA
jgi:type VI secretion system FHA domain protein